MRIREIRTKEELYALADAWDALLGARGEQAICSSFAWITTWWSHFSKGKELFVLVAEEDDRVVGIAPLYLATFQRKKFLRFKRAYFLGEGLSDYGCFLTHHDPSRVCRAFLAHLRTRKCWHELRLQNISDTRGDFDQLCAAGLELGYRVNAEARKPTHCFYLNTAGDFGEYLKNTSRDVKKDVPRRLNMIEDAGGYDLKFTGELPLSHLLDAIGEIHAKRQAELGRESFFQHEDERAFIREICGLYDQRGWLDTIAMRMEGRIVAYMLGFRHGGVRYSWNVGFDPKYNELSLGKVLAYLWIEDAFRRKDITEFNFMRGDSDFKRKFTEQCRWNHHFILRHPRSLYVRGIGLAEKVWKSRE